MKPLGKKSPREQLQGEKKVEVRALDSIYISEEGWIEMAKEIPKEH